MTDGISPDMPIPRPPDESTPASTGGGDGPEREAPHVQPEVRTNPPRGDHDIAPHARSEPTDEEEKEAPGLTTDSASKLRVDLEALGNSQEDMELLMRAGLANAGKVEPLTPEEIARLDEMYAEDPQRVRQSIGAINESMTEELAPPSEDAPDDASELTGDEPDQPQKLSEEEAERQAYERESERLAREAHEKVQASIKDPLDVDKREAASKAIDAAKNHHDKHGEHGADNLANTDPFWVKLVNGVAVAFYIYVGLQYMAAAAAQNVAKGSGGR